MLVSGELAWLDWAIPFGVGFLFALVGGVALYFEWREEMRDRD